MWLPWWLSGKESTCQGRRYRLDPWVRKIPWILTNSKCFFGPWFGQEPSPSLQMASFSGRSLEK